MTETTEYVARSSGGGSCFDGFVYVRPLGGQKWDERLVTCVKGFDTRRDALAWARGEIRNLRTAAR